MAVIAVLGALDTKGVEFHYLLTLIQTRGHSPFLIDIGVLQDSALEPAIPARIVAEAGGSSLEQLRARADRGEAMRTMARGAAHVVAKLYAEGRLAGIIGMGGSGGTSIFAAAVQSLPIGFPKVLVTTLASGDTSSFVGVKDLVLVPSVVDIAGLNRISRWIIRNAAGAICGMVEAQSDAEKNPTHVDDKPIIAATMLGNTTAAVTSACGIFEAAGYEVLVFHAIGSGGRTMESLIADHVIAGVFDLTTTELAAQLIGAPTQAGMNRLCTAGELGIPQLIAPGCLDFAIFWNRETIPSQYANRRLYSWNPETTLMRTSPEENATLGRMLAERANAAKRSVAVIVPLRGLSALDAEGKPHWHPEADAALFAALSAHLRADIPLIRVDAHINDPEFARCAAQTMLELMGKQ